MLTMREKLIKKTEEYSKVQNKFDEAQAEIAELREEMFGDNSEDTKERAQELFSEVSQSGASKSEQLESLEEKQEKLRQQRADLRDEIREELVDIRFPLDETIQTDNAPPIKFPYDESIEPHVLKAIEELYGDKLDDDFVTIGTDEITVDTDSVDNAIDAVENKVMDIREHAERLLDIEAHVEKVRNRDEKVAAMMYVLTEYGDDDGMTKAEMEDAIGIERGSLRGILYHVIDETPYMKKLESEVRLTTTGQELIERFVETYGTPALIEVHSEDDDERDESTDEKEVENQEVTAYE